MKINYPTLESLSEEQRNHMAWRLDHNTGYGLLTISKICRLENMGVNYLPLNKVLEHFGMKKHQAKIHARKIINFKD